eukprot:CAMPEP_0175060426 /NCGR_PEP_ID=MMETSP0052_2-20121109/13005_1 /TAXON_ID=51329 ORGANISM="Polytomella parva, Strain SAG 63-3" /NCGR_SAMPLE_ID=MMETSP0052_2 /ASSEMBLY_ACC=CAM_ASM_000194 /LENGTH=226 /DNA_ID=CAMNT_0016326133 /DNA_START=342 /DNA_END=1018 /DNA_ORIENTATION=-
MHNKYRSGHGNKARVSFFSKPESSHADDKKMDMKQTTLSSSFSKPNNEQPTPIVSKGNDSNLFVSNNKESIESKAPTLTVQELTTAIVKANSLHSLQMLWNTCNSIMQPSHLALMSYSIAYLVQQQEQMFLAANKNTVYLSLFHRSNTLASSVGVPSESSDTSHFSTHAFPSNLDPLNNKDMRRLRQWKAKRKPLGHVPLTLSPSSLFSVDKSPFLTHSSSSSSSS